MTIIFVIKLKMNRNNLNKVYMKFCVFVGIIIGGFSMYVIILISLENIIISKANTMYVTNTETRDLP